jgi:hypothetical protein
MSADLEARLRALPERLDALRARSDLAEAVRRRHRRRRRRMAAAAAAATVAVLAGTTVALGTVRDRAPTAPARPVGTSPAPPQGPAPTDPHLLRWPTRGPLAGDAAERAAVLRDLDTFARGDLSTYLELRLRPPSAAPTHILWLGPASPEPLPVPTGTVAVVQQWNGEGVLLVLEKRDGRYRLVGEGGGRYWTRAPAHVGVLWVPYECSWPPAGVRCPRRYDGVVLAAPGTRRIRLAIEPYQRYQGNFDRVTWRDLDTVDGTAVLTMRPEDVSGDPLAAVMLDGVVGFPLRMAGGGPLPPP